MYLEYFQLIERPFKNIPDIQSFYFSAQHEEALAKMFYTLVEQRGAMLLTGDCGCGKTIIARLFYNELRKRRDLYKLAFIDNPNLNHLEILKEILYQLGAPQTSNDKTILLQTLGQTLLEAKRQNKETVIIIDEVQLIQSKATLEEIRLLLNFHQDQSFLLTLFLIGQPEFKTILEHFPQLVQRLNTRVHLNPMNLEDTCSYIEWQIKATRSEKKDLFTSEAKKAIHYASHGVPRVINHICDMALLKAFSQQKNNVEKETIFEVLKSDFTIKKMSI